MTEDHLNTKKIQGVMFGRLAYGDPWEFRDVDNRFYNSKNPGYNKKEILELYSSYVETFQKEEKYKYPDEKGTPIAVFNKPIINLFNGEKSCKRWKRYLSDSGNHKNIKNYKEYIMKGYDFFLNIEEEKDNVLIDIEDKEIKPVKKEVEKI